MAKLPANEPMIRLQPSTSTNSISLNGIDIILSSVRVQSYDPSLFTALGIDPTQKHLLVIKSTNHFYAAFSQIASEILYCAAGTPYPNNPAKTAYRHVRRDIWPIMANPHEAPEDSEAA